MLAPTIIIGDMNANPTPAARLTGHTPVSCSPPHRRNAGARGPDGQPLRPTIPIFAPNRGHPLPHQRMLMRLHDHHPAGGPMRPLPTGTHRRKAPAYPPLHPQPSPQPPRGCGPRHTKPPENTFTARQTSLVPVSQGQRPRPAQPTRPHRPTHRHAHTRHNLQFSATTPR